MKRTVQKCGVLTREAEVEEFRTVPVRDDQQTQEVTLSLSSEYPVQRWFGMEVLSHKRGAIRLGRLNNGGPLLLNHDHDQQVGAFVRDSVKVGDDKKVRGVARFSRSARAKEIADDVDMGIRGATSIGYRVHKMKRARDMEETNPETGEPIVEWWLATDWEPMEGSIVPVPADPGTGVGRMLDMENEVEFIDEDEEKKMSEPIITATVAPVTPALPVVDKDAIARDAAVNERRRIGEFRAVQGKFGLSDEYVQTHIDAGTSVEAFRADVMANWKPDMVRTAPSILGLTGKEINKFSLCRAISAQITGDWKHAGFERECSRAAREADEKQGLETPSNAIFIPNDVRWAQMQRANLLGGSAEGVELVGSVHMGNTIFIDALRNTTRVLEAGATVLSGLVGNPVIPRQTAAIAAGVSATEVTAYTEGAPTYDQVTLNPKIVNSWQPVSRQLLLQGTPDVETMLMRDITLAIGIKADQQFLYGTPPNGQMQGLSTLSGIGGVDFGEIAPTWAKVVECETDLGAANVDTTGAKYILNAKTRGKFKTILVTVTYGDRLIWEVGANTVNGYPVLISNQVTSNTGTGSAFSTGFFGVWSELVVGMWGSLTIVVDPYTLATTHLVRLVAHQHMDAACKHPVAFTYLVGIPN
jgi:phage head maturation protease